MSTIQEPQPRCKGQTVSDEYRKWVFLHMPHVGSLLDKLDAGEAPNFLDVMAAISERVALCTECDSFESAESLRFSEMSGKYCRFCY